MLLLSTLIMLIVGLLAALSLGTAVITVTALVAADLVKKYYLDKDKGTK